MSSARVVKLVDTADLKSAAFVNNGRAGSIPASGTTLLMRVSSGLKQNNYTENTVAQSLHKIHQRRYTQVHAF